MSTKYLCSLYTLLLIHSFKFQQKYPSTMIINITCVHSIINTEKDYHKNLGGGCDRLFQQLVPTFCASIHQSKKHFDHSFSYDGHMK